MGGFAIPLPQRNQLIAGQIAQVVVNGTTINFPSTKFCKKYVTDDFLKKIENSICGKDVLYKGNGEVTIGRHARCGHVHITTRDAAGWEWGAANTTIYIRGYGTKSSGTPRGSGGYDWET